MTLSVQTVEREITRQIKARGAGKTICPSEVARVLAEDWRVLMPLVREVADQMAARGLVLVTQKGVTVKATAARGPIRLGQPVGRG
jgi:DNA-binding FadR family transcriptional regulator